MCVCVWLLGETARTAHRNRTGTGHERESGEDDESTTARRHERAGARRDAADANSESDVNSESRLIYSAAEKPAMRWDSHLTTHHHMPVQESIKVALLHWFTVRVAALAGSGRAAYARGLLCDHLKACSYGGVGVELQLDLGESGDVRPLVRQMRSLAVCARHLLESEAPPPMAAAAGGSPVLRIVQLPPPATTDGAEARPTDDGSGSARATILLSVADGARDGAATARLGVMPVASGGCMLPADGRLLHPLSRAAIAPLLAALGGGDGGGGDGDGDGDDDARTAIRHVVDLYLSGALAPAVVVCTARPKAQALAAALLDALSGALGGAAAFGAIRGVDVHSVKMNRSLYDPRDTRSLRDEILDRKAFSPYVCVELLCETAGSELLIREMVEDSPSLVAHSVHKRILRKDGLLFVVRLGAATSADGITPELLSRASLVL